MRKKLILFKIFFCLITLSSCLFLEAGNQKLHLFQFKAKNLINALYIEKVPIQTV